MSTPSNRNSKTPTRVLCVDDSTDMTLMMQMLIDAESTMKCAGCLDSADTLIKTVGAMKPTVDVVVLDATMPGEDPLVEMNKLCTRFPEVKTIVFSGHDDDEFVARVKALGGWGCVSKRDEPEVIVRAIREVAAGNQWFPGD